MGSSLIGSFSSSATSGSPTASSLTLAVGDFVTATLQAQGVTTAAMVDSLTSSTNVYTNQVQSATGPVNAICQFSCLVTQAGTTTFTFTNPAAIQGVIVQQFRSTNGYSGLLGTAVGGTMSPGGYTGANVVTSAGFTNPNVGGSGNALYVSFLYDQNITTNDAITAGTAQSWALYGGTPVLAYLASEYLDDLGSACPITYGIAANGYNTFHITGLAVSEGAGAAVLPVSSLSFMNLGPG